MIISIPVIIELGISLMALWFLIITICFAIDALYLLVFDRNSLDKLFQTLVYEGGATDIVSQVEDRAKRLLGPNLSHLFGDVFFENVKKNWLLNFILQFVISLPAGVLQVLG